LFGDKRLVHDVLSMFILKFTDGVIDEI